MNESMNRLQTFIINFKQKCLEHGVEYKPRDKKEFDNFYKMGFVLSNYKLGYYDVHLLIDYEDNLKAIHLLGIEHLYDCKGDTEYECILWHSRYC